MLKKIFLFSILFFIPYIAFSASATISYFSPSTTVSVGQEVFFRVNPSGFSGEITYTVLDGFYSTSVSNSNINSTTGNFTWTPRSQDVGTHNITINLLDTNGNSASVVQTITVPVVPTITIQNLYPGSSVNSGHTVFFNVSTLGFTNPLFSISDSFESSSMTSANINASGGVSWTPQKYDVGTHTLTIKATESSNSSTYATVTQTITVGTATTTISSISPGKTITARQTITFKINATGFTNPTYSISSNLTNSINANVSGSGEFSWTPTLNDVGSHIITIKTKDSSGNSSSIDQEIIVISPKLEIQSIKPSNTITINTPVSFNATTTGFSNPKYTIIDSFGGSSISNTNIDSLGNFSWTPKTQDIGSHSVKITASDSLGNIASLETNITVSKDNNQTTVANTSNSLNSSNNSSGYIFTKYIGLGSKGEDVLALQKILIKLGLLSGDPTGFFGSLTEKAVKDLQKSKNLEQVGGVGPSTRAVLNNIDNNNNNINQNNQNTSVNSNTTNTSNISKYVFTKPMTLGDQNDEIKELQKKLTELLIYSGPITGYYGNMTRSAVITLQAKEGLEQVGSIGPSTRAVLNR